MGLLQEVFQQLVNGLALGSIYALIALGYTMVYGIAKLINFAHGDILMLGAFAGFFVLITASAATPILYIVSFVVAMAICAAIGVIMEKTCYKPLRNAPRMNALITAIGLSFFLENGARVFPPIGPNPKQFPTLANVNFNLFGVNISQVQIIVFIVSIGLMVLLNYIVNYTKVGKAMRAVSFDRGAAYLMGINVNRIISFTFAIGSALAAAAGILFSTAYPQVEPYMGIMPGIKAFVAAVLGGIGSIPGAMIGGFILGVAETLTKGFISSQLADAIAFGILIVILIVKPTGILGANVSEKV
ncbi:branched-chain amino acid transport system permease protein [Hydrogenispora ethanolica]|uniref:Branched-chain amino acid transport system permease protein n=1 Tax=Hydrogenispora ethanolica TaxID=1082276 RepID=A0A4R1SD39_HYDET|nr:branched-chain amino acid ABC transporter permease [Hydrogenispora ethanolica]TCL76522.1 branched-chain amino acid transport system permease protein [Hydrogenispora ethanolica]